MLDKRASWMHATCVVVLILSANTGAENEMLKIDCDSCVYGTGLKQSKRHNECYVPTLGLAALSTLDGSVIVEHIFTFLQKRKLLDGNFEICQGCQRFLTISDPR